MLGSALKRVRDEHAVSDPDLRRDMLRRGKRRRLLRLTGAAAGAVAVLVLAATTIPILREEAAPGPAGPRQPTVTATLDLISSAIVANDDSVWVASPTGSMSRIDTSTNDVVEGPPVLSEHGVNDMAFGPDGIWAVGWEGDIGPGGEAQSELQIVDPESLEVIEEPSIPIGDTALYSATVGERGTVWVVNAASDQVLKMDPETEAVMEIPTGRFPVDVIAAAGGAWVSNSKSGTITEIDARGPITDSGRPGDVVGEFPVECPGDLVIAFGSLWVTNYCENQIRRIDLSGPRVVANIPTGKGPLALVEAGGYMWVVNTLDETVVRVDPSTNRVIGEPIDVGASPESIVSGGGAVWVANRNSVSRIDYERQPDPPFTPLPSPSSDDNPADRGEEAFAMWPETTPAQAEAECGRNTPGWRADATEVGLRFTREVIGWPDATQPDVVQLRKSGGAVMSISRSEAEPDVRVLVSVAPTLFEGGCLSVVRVSSPGRVGNVLVELTLRPESAVVDVRWDPGGAASAEVLVGFSDLEQVQTVTVPRCRFVFAEPATEPGYVLVLLEDDGGEVISAMGRPLPAGNLTLAEGPGPVRI
jgi:streptogramin lyase